MSQRPDYDGPDVGRIKLVLDLMGRAMDEESGKYLRFLRFRPAHPVDGWGIIRLGGDVGWFLTQGDDGELLPWEPPDDWMIN